MELSFLGATGTVTGSRYLITDNGQHVLVDCGLFQGYKQLRLKNWAPPPFDPRAIKAVVLTHAHLDHSGYLPLLVKLGFRGRIYCSRATFELCKILLPDSGFLQEEQAHFDNKHGTSKHKPALPLYTIKDAEACLKRFEPVRFEETFELSPGLSAVLRRAGHLLGAGSAYIKNGKTTVGFSGDLGRTNDPLMNAPEPIAECDYLVLESTYGDRTHPLVDMEAELAIHLAPACARQATIVVPAFAVGRAQLLLHLLTRLKAKKIVPDIPVYLDSPMAIDASELYKAFSHEHRLTPEECRSMFRSAILVRTAAGSKALAEHRGPKIIVSASGMATGGRVVHHLKRWAPDPKALILLTGFQAGGTRGAALAAGAKTLRIHGEEIPIRAQVLQLQSMSAHADASGLIEWIRTAANRPKAVFLTHGEPAASDALRQRIERELQWNVSVPEFKESVAL